MMDGRGKSAHVRRGHLMVSGRVQGVCFRMYACQKARQLGLSGFVRNLADGRVEIVAEGDMADLSQLVSWCGHGPPMAEVTRVAETYLDATGEFSNFDVAF